MLVTLLGSMPLVRKEEQMVESWSAWCTRRWRKRRAAEDMGSPWVRLVASMVVDSPRTLLLCMSRNRVTSQAQRKVLEGES